MADGRPNEGLYQTSLSIKSALSILPNNTKMISLGYGNDFKLDTLEAVGDFSYIENSEKIPIIFGSLAGEILEAVAFNGKLTYPDTLPNDSKEISGHFEVKVVSKNQSYNHAILLPNHYDKNNLIGRIVKFKYFDLNNDYPEDEISNRIVDGGEITPEIRTMYYKASMGRLTKILYHKINTESKLREKIKFVKNRLQLWTDNEAQQFKEELLRLIEDIEEFKYGSNDYVTCTNRITTISSEYRMQHGYTDIGNNRSNRQQICCDQATSAANYYI